jgi:HrpA-like RNA helicase
LFRLYRKEDCENSPDQTTPEILAADISGTLLAAAVFGLTPADFENSNDFIDTPAPESVIFATEQLYD